MGEQTGEQFFRNGQRMMVADMMQVHGKFVNNEPRVLFEVRCDASDSTNYDVSPNEQRFVIIETDPQGDGRRLEVVQNWFEDLKARVPVD